MVTAELAVSTLTAFTLFLAMCWGIYLVILQVRCIDTASAVARQVARGDNAAAAHAKANAPHGSRVEVQRRSDLVTVTVRLTAQPLGRDLVTVPLTAQAAVTPEPEGSG
jgi:hypothetical protein